MAKLFPAAVAVACLLLASTAGATYPGEPGLLTWSTSAGYHDGSSSIWGRDVFDGGLTHITSHRDSSKGPPYSQYVSDTDPSWAPDGKRFAFIRETRGTRRVYVARAKGSGARPVVGDGVMSDDPAFGPGGRIVFTRTIGSDEDYVQELWSVRADGTQLRRLTKGYGADAAWSPDGRRIVFDNGYAHGEKARLSVMRADGSDEHVLSSRCGDAAQPSFGPGGDRLAVLYQPKGAEQSHLYTMGLGCRHKRLVTRRAAWPVWSPDGGWIAYFGGPRGHNGTYVIHPDGTGRRRVPGSGGLDLDWQARP